MDAPITLAYHKPLKQYQADACYQTYVVIVTKSREGMYMSSNKRHRYDENQIQNTTQ